MFENDWILASLSNPTLDINDLASIGGLTTNNTQFLSKDQYLKSNFIKDNPAFKDQYGNFSNEKFDNFYETQASRWRDFQNNEFPKGIELDAFDTASNRADSKVKNISFSIGPTNNPDRVQIGIEGWRTTSKRTKSESEIAQSQKIYNPETGEFENQTPEDSTLFGSPINWVKNLFKDPLVLAQYEEGELDENGNKRKKGEYKLNEYGTYYYERLNGRSPLGKTVLSSFDILTKEDSALNKIDFFDSDDLEKSTAGVVAKNIALIAPMFTPAAPLYYKAIIAKELTKTLPMLYSVATNLFGSGDNETPEWMNNLAAKGESLTTSTSMWSKEHTFSFENFANLISDVALQWGQQKQIAKAVNWFRGDQKALQKAEKQAFDLYKSKIGGDLKGLEAPTDELWKSSTLGQLALKKYYEPVLETMKKRQRLGADLALAYMALISNTDVYADMLEKGATKKEAAWVALGSTAAMFSVDRFAHLGEVFYDDLTAESIKQGRQAVKKEFKEAFEEIYKEGTKIEKSPSNLFKKGADLGKRAAEIFIENLKDHNLGFTGKALGEGLEEVSEELVTDLTKATYSLLGDLGMYDASVKNPIDYDTMLERYTMSLLGGAIGGGLFYGVEKYKGFNKTRDRDLVDLINDGKAQELRTLVEEYASKGEAGNTKISGIEYSRDPNTGAITWLSTNNERDSQNRYVANKVIEKINSLEATIVGSGTKLNKDQLFDKMVLQEARYQGYKNASHVTGYYQEFKKLQNQYLQAKSNYDKAITTLEGTPEGTIMTDEQKRNLDQEQQTKRQSTLQLLQQQVDNAQKRINDFLSGDSSLDYTRKLNFALDPVLNAAFLDLNRGEWLLSKINPDQELTLADQINLDKEWNDHVKDVMLNNLDKAFLAYKALEQVVSPEMLNQQEFSKQYRNIFNAVQQLYNNEDLSLDKFLKEKPFYTMDSRLVDENGIEESEEQYNARYNTTTPDEVQIYNQRVQRVFDLNTQLLQQYIQKYDDILKPINYSIDSSTNRTLIQNIGLRIKDIIKREMQYPFLVSGSMLDVSPYQNIFMSLRDDLSNIDDIQKQLQDSYYTKVKEESNKIIGSINNMVPSINIIMEPIIKEKNINKIIEEINNSNLENKQEIISNIQSTFAAREKAFDEDADERTIYELDKQVLQQIPIQFKKQEYKTIKDILNLLSKKSTAAFGLKGEGILGDDLSINDLITELQNPDSEVYQFISSKLSTLPETLVQILSQTQMSFGKDAKFRILLEGDPKGLAGDTMKLQLNSLQKYSNNLVNRVQKNPVYDFYNKLKVNSHSPLENILSSINKEISTSKEDLVNLNYILNQVYKDYISADTQASFELNDSQAKQLNNAEKSLQLLSAYIYAASTEPNGRSYFGQNKQINEFANNHKDVLTKEWQPLPEIDQDYAQLLQREISNLDTEIQIWKAISLNNGMNKLRRFTDTAKISNDLKYNIIKGLSFKFTVGDKEYDLSEGLDQLPAFNKDDEENQLNQVFQAEQKLYNNFQRILSNSKLSAKQFFENSDFWKTYLGNYSDIELQKTSRLNENLKGFTKYDQALYLLSILSDNPSNYYKSLSNSIKDNENIAPLTIQQNISRLGEAVHTRTYKEGFKSLIKLIDPKVTVTPNTFYMNGVAGAGKTEVCFKSIRQRFYDQEALVVGPTTSQAIKLQNSLNENISYTIDGDSSIFKKLFPEWDKMNEEFKKAEQKINYSTDDKESIDTDYFTISRYVSPGFDRAKINLKIDKIKFNPDVTAPLIFVDEAAHLNTFQIAMLDAYADKVGGTLFLASDSNQSGYGEVDRIGNLKPSNIFCTRTSKLQESLRSSNIQKQSNNNKVSNILDTIDYIIETGDAQQWDIFEKQLPNLIHNLNLRVYNKDEINGDLINNNLSEILPKIPKDANIGFIGDENSKAYQTLKAAGFTNLSDALTAELVPGKKFMQGQEFDYVFIDKFELPDTIDGFTGAKYSIPFLRKFNTLMTRGKIASIFLDNNLTKLVGENTIDEMKSIGFDISGQINTFRDSYLKALSKLDLSETTQEEKPEVTPEPEVKEQEGELVISPTVDNSPELNPENSQEEIQKQLEADKQQSYNNFSDPSYQEKQNDIEVSNLSDLFIEANTVVPITGLQETYTNPDGTTRKYSAWLPGEKTSVRRNLNAIYDGEEPITKLSDKQRYQDILSRIQSSIIFGGDLKDPALTSLIGFDQAWKNRKIQFEIRKATDYDNFGVGTDLGKPNYIDINGEKYIISIICRLDGLSKTLQDSPFSAIFDICWLSDFNNLKNPQVQQAIKDKINRKIAEGKISDRAKAESFRDNLSASIKQYEEFIKKVVKDNPDGYTIDLSEDMYESHKTTRLVKRTVPRRLGGTLSIATVENNIVDKDGNYIEDYKNFMDTDKRKVVSPVYIVGNRSDVLKGVIPESIFGKAVVFVSSNTNLSPEELPERYIEQKKNPSVHTPEVRMVLLNNHGLSFTELVTHRIQKLLNGEGEKSKKPWRMDTLGIRMFTAMWNFRAGLENFLIQLDKWKKENNYNENKVLSISKVEAELFNRFGKKWESQLDTDDAKNLLNTYKVTISDLKNLIKFNQEYCKDIPTFRLGIDFTNKEIGGFIRQFDVSNSSIYGKNQANMIALEEEYARKYHTLLSTILSQLTSNEAPKELKLVGFDFKPMHTKLVKSDGTDFKTNEYIGKNEQKRNLSGLIHTTNKNIILGETDNDGKIISSITIGANSIFSFFPKAISTIATKSRIYQTHSKASGLISISTIDTKDRQEKFDFDISSLFKEGLLTRRGNDNTLFNMFNLIFHGTTKSLEESHAYTEDAPFKYGIFVDPDLEESQNYKQINIRGNNGQDYTFLRCGTNPIYFDVDVDVIPGGMAVNLTKLINGGNKPVSNNQPQKNNPIKQQIGYSSQIIDQKEKIAFSNYILNNGLEDSQENYSKFVSSQNTKRIKIFFRTGVYSGDILSLINLNLQGRASLKDVKFENNKIIYTDQDGNTGELSLDEEDMYITLTPDNSNSYEDLTKQSFNSIVKDPTGEDIMSHQDFLNQLEEMLPEDDQVNQLSNSSNVENYLNLLETLRDSITNKVSALEETDEKYKMLDYLMYIDTSCF